MSNGSTALGKYATIVAVIVILAVIGVWLGLIIVDKPTDKLDLWAGAAFGVVLGVGGALTRLNGTVAKVEDHDEKITRLSTTVQANSAATEINTDERLSRGF